MITASSSPGSPAASSRRFRRTAGACLGLLLAASGVGPAAADAFSWDGFGTLGLVHNNSDDFGFIRDLTQGSGARNGATAKVDSNLGVQLEYRFRSDIKGVVQVVSRHEQDGSIPPEVTWAFLKYSPDPAWELRAGRLGWDVYMLSDSRNVGYSLPWVRPPIEYFAVQQISHLDGFDIVATRRVGKGVIWGKVYGGYADEKLPLDDGTDFEMEGSQVYGAHLNYQIGHWWLRAGYANTRLDNEADSLKPLFAFMRSNNETSAKLADNMKFENATVRHFVAGGVYSRGPFQAQLMVDRGKTDTLVFPSFLAGYTTLSYRLGDWTPYATFAAVESDEVSRDSGFLPGSPPDRNIQATLRGSRIDQHTTSFGVRYDFYENMALKLQVDRLWVHDADVSLMRKPDTDWNGRGTIVSVTLDFVF